MCWQNGLFPWPNAMRVATGKIADLTFPRQFVMTAVIANHTSVSCPAMTTIIAHIAPISAFAMVTDQTPTTAATYQTLTIVLTTLHDGRGLSSWSG